MVDKSHQVHSILFVHNTRVKAIEIFTEKFNNFHLQAQFWSEPFYTNTSTQAIEISTWKWNNFHLQLQFQRQPLTDPHLCNTALIKGLEITFVLNIYRRFLENVCYNSRLYCTPIVGSSEKKNLLRYCNMFHITWINLFVKCMNQQMHLNFMTYFYL